MSHAERPLVVEQPWRSILLTNGERSLIDSGGDLERQKGATLRIIDLPAVLAGEDISDRLIGNPQGAARSTAKKRLLKRLWKACKLHHGVAFDTYISYLIEHRRKLPSLINQSVRVFEDGVSHHADSDLTRDLARKFGLLFAGAQLAISGNIVGWTTQIALDSITLAYTAARSLLPDDARDLRQGIAKLLRVLKFLPRSTVAAGDIDGYRRSHDGFFDCLIRVEKFQAVFDSVSQRKLVETWLIQEGRIELAQLKRRSSTVREAKVQHIWWDGKRKRSYRITWPMMRSVTTATRS